MQKHLKVYNNRIGKVNLKNASILYFIGNLFNKGIAFLAVPIFTRILSTNDYGIVNTYNSWIGIVSMVIGFALHMAIRSAFLDFKENIDDFLSVTITFVLYSGGLISAIVLICTYFIKIEFELTLVFLCLIHGMATAIIQDYSMYLMMEYRYKLRTAFMILPNLLSVIISIFVIRFIVKEQAYMGRIIPTALVTVFFGFIVCCLVYHKSSKLFDKRYIQYGLNISAPLILHGLALNILSQSDRTMITVLADASQTGIYSLIHNFGLIATVITTSLEGIWVPWFMGKLKEREIDTINIAAKSYVEIMTCAMIGVILVGPEVVKVFAPDRYWEGIIIIPLIVLSNYFIFAYTLYVNIEHYYKRTKYISFNTIVAALTNLVLNYLLIPIYGYKGAAVTTVISYILAFIMHANYSKKLEKDLYPLTSFVLPLIKMILGVIIFYVFMEDYLVRWTICMIYTLGYVFSNRTVLENYLKVRG